MFFRSIKFQLGLIAFLFVIFVSIVLFQIYFNEKMQREEIIQLEKSHKIISNYLVVEETERSIIGALESFIDDKNVIPQADVDALKERIVRWHKKLQAWNNELDTWRATYEFTFSRDVFDKSFRENKRRQALVYSNAVDLCGKRNFKEAKIILNIDNAFLPKVNNTIIAILDGISEEIEMNRAISARFYYSTAASILMALIALLFAAFSIIRRLSISMGRLEEGAQRISNGDFDTVITVEAPLELQRLAKSFNEMQDAVRSRDDKIRDDSKEIQKLNSILEQKVEDRNKTILNQNISLKRKNEELEQILYAASHDLRTPLISIQGFSEELKVACGSLENELNKGDKLDKTVIEQIVKDEVVLALNYIINGSKRMEVLLEGLLRLSRMGRESLDIQKIDMNELLGNVADTLSFQLNEADAELKIDDLCECNGDRSQIEQVFFNLISNAIKYREPKRKCAIQVFSERVEGFSRYHVKDNGLGIPEEYSERVFHAFYRVDEDAVEGEGLGLAIVNRAVDLHSGRIWVESEIGKGSSFILEIPENAF